ncbi:hypothetical protein NC651_012676 [Populus alba x Populus x berolinensis]|nr:hypothetical protein NC651_012676 [Populus alba x Populus x berolinensis]
MVLAFPRFVMQQCSTHTTGFNAFIELEGKPVYYPTLFFTVLISGGFLFLQLDPQGPEPLEHEPMPLATDFTIQMSRKWSPPDQVFPLKGGFELTSDEMV